MIIREIKQQPELMMLPKFDWFNDYIDTRSYAVHCCPELVATLDEGWRIYLTLYNFKNFNRYNVGWKPSTQARALFAAMHYLQPYNTEGK